MLSEQDKYAEAIPHLEEDTENPEAMFCSARLTRRRATKRDAKVLAKRLAGMNEPTVEQALVVPQFRVAWAEEQSRRRSSARTCFSMPRIPIFKLGSDRNHPAGAGALHALALPRRAGGGRR